MPVFSIRSLPVAFALLGAMALALPAQGVSICQKKNRLKLRAAECKTKETFVGVLEFEEEPPPAAPGLPGIWRAIAEETGTSTRLASRDRIVEQLELREDGTGSIHHANPDSALIRCTDFYYSGPVDLVIDRDGEEESTVVWATDLDGDALSVRDAVGNRVDFERSNESDPPASCTPLVEVARFEELPDPHTLTGLVFEGGFLYYRSAEPTDVQEVDPTTGALGTPLDLGSFEFVHAADPGALWAHSGSGGSREAVKTSLAGLELDRINIEEVVGERFGIDAMASDPPNGRIWAASRDRIVQVAPGPDTILSSEAFAHELEGMVFSEGEIWFVTQGNEIGRMDTETLEVLESYRLDTTTLQLDGIAASETELFILADVGDFGTIFVLQKP